jgi:hypothetical protein
MGGGLLAAASALRSVLPLFGPPGAEVVVVAAAGAGDGVPFVGLLLLRRPTPIEWGCSYLRRGNRSSVCNGTLDASVFVHYGCRGLNMYVILARSRVFSSFSSTKSESPRVKVTSEVSVSRRRRSPSARLTLLSEASLAQLKGPLGRSSMSRGQG